MKNKLVKLILFITILFSFNCTVYATEYVNEASSVLNKMKIIIGDENGDLQLNKNLTRAEFATIIVRLVGKENTIPEKSDLNFDDFSSSFWGYNNIYICVNSGYLKGDGNGKFRPNDVIKYEEVCTIMLRILEKEKNLTKWPDDFIIKATDLGITKNTTLKISDKISRGNACVLIYNSLNISL